MSFEPETASLVEEFKLLTHELLECARKRASRKGKSRRGLARGHARNLLKKKESLRRRELYELLAGKKGKHKKTRRSIEVTPKRTVSEILRRLKQIVSLFEKGHEECILYLSQGFCPPQVNKMLGRALGRIARKKVNLRDKVIRSAAKKLEGALSPSVVSEYLPVLLLTEKAGLVQVKKIIENASQRKKRLILFALFSLIGRLDQQAKNQIVEIAHMVCDDSLSRVTTRVAALKIVSKVDYGESSISRFICELQRPGCHPVIRRIATDSLSHGLRKFHAIKPLLAAFVEVKNRKRARIILKCISRVGNQMPPRMPIADLRRIGEYTFKFRSLDEVLALAVAQVPSWNYSGDRRLLYLQLQRHVPGMSPVQKCGVVKSLLMGSSGQYFAV